jgi:hypothetical protein
MDTFFAYLKKALVATVFVMFAVVATYVPQSWNDVKAVHAGAATGGATEVTQVANNVQLAAVNSATTISAGFDSVTSWATGSLWVKENLLDGIAWALAKGIVSSMVQSLINWINSGFQGSPSFVQDLQGFLLQAADQAMGEYIQSLGGLGSFICSPFQLNVQIALSLQYQVSRQDRPEPTCTLSGIINNIEGFIDGNFNVGGWDDWFDVTANPQQYTPYGSVLTAESGAAISIINAQGEEVSLLDFGDGFLSGEICETVNTGSGPEEDCFISKPGKIIEEALSFNLDSGRQSLITADEINEIIAALLGQLANQAITGAAGLLGLSGGTGYTDTSFSGYSGSAFVDQVAQDSGADPATLIATMNDALAVQTAYRNLAVNYTSAPAPDLVAYAADPNNEAGNRQLARDAVDEANQIINDTNEAIAVIPNFITELNDPATTVQRQNEIMQEYSQLTIYRDSNITSSRNAWDSILRQ